MPLLPKCVFWLLASVCVFVAVNYVYWYAETHSPGTSRVYVGYPFTARSSGGFSGAIETRPEAWLLNIGVCLLAGAVCCGADILIRHIWKRVRRRPGHCPACDYNLRGLDEPRSCPECGAIVGDAKPAEEGCQQ